MVSYVDIISLCQSVAILLEIYVMQLECNVRWLRFQFKRMIITGLDQQTSLLTKLSRFIRGKGIIGIAKFYMLRSLIAIFNNIFKSGRIKNFIVLLLLLIYIKKREKEKAHQCTNFTTFRSKKNQKSFSQIFSLILNIKYNMYL